MTSLKIECCTLASKIVLRALSALIINFLLTLHVSLRCQQGNNGWHGCGSIFWRKISSRVSHKARMVTRAILNS